MKEGPHPYRASAYRLKRPRACNPGRKQTRHRPRTLLLEGSERSSRLIPEEHFLLLRSSFPQDEKSKPWVKGRQRLGSLSQLSGWSGPPNTSGSLGWLKATPSNTAKNNSDLLVVSVPSLQHQRSSRRGDPILQAQARPRGQSLPQAGPLPPPGRRQRGSPLEGPR